jgi:ribonuclease VapC
VIVVDSSAVIAILKKEPDGPSFLKAIQDADHAIISAVNVHEAGMVLRARLGPEGAKDLHELLGPRY